MFKHWLTIGMLCAVVIAAPVALGFEPPSDARVLNVLNFGAVGDGVADDTAAINAALAAARPAGATGKIIYLPPGTYRVTDTIAMTEPRTTLMGASATLSVVRLDDGAGGYGDPMLAKRVVSTRESSGFSANQFRVNLFDLTIDAGANNPGAVGLLLHQNNTGGLRNVIIRSSDPNGVGLVGLDLSGSDKGPGLIRNVRIEGFDVGVAMSGTEYSMVFEGLELRNQNVVGINNTWDILTIRDLFSDNAVPAIRNNKATANDFRWGMITLIDAVLSGGSAGNAAIDNESSLYLRNVSSSGYDNLLRERGVDLPGATIAGEFTNQRPVSIFPTPPAMLNRPIRDYVQPASTGTTGWVNAESFGADGTTAGDDSAGIQAAIDSGAATVYLPAGDYEFANPIILRGNLERLVCFESNLRAIEPLASSNAPLIEVGAGSATQVIVELANVGAGNGPGVLHPVAGRELVLRNGSYGRYVGDGAGVLFQEDTVNGPWHFANGHTVYARQMNPENAGVKITNDASELVILGLKTEKQGTIIETRGGGITELLGGLIYPVQGIPIEQPMFIIRDSAFSAVIGESAFIFDAFHRVVVEETRAGVLRRLWFDDIPRRVGFSWGAQLNFYAGYVDPSLPTPAGPLVELLLDETTGPTVPDTSGNGNDGTIVGGAAWAPASGLNSGALMFDGVDDYVDLPTGLLGTQQGAASLWINTTNDFADNALILYASDGTTGNGGGSENEFQISILSDERISFFIESGAQDFSITTDGGGFNDGGWHHLVISWDRDGTSEFWVNGRRVGSRFAANFNAFEFAGRLRLGQPNAGTRRYNGLLDEVRLWDRTLTQSEVLDLYFQGLGVTNYAPAVEAGRDVVAQNDTFTANLEGQANDDGQPSGQLAVSWSVLSGPAGVVFSDASDPEATATFPQAGTYELELSADDTLERVADTTRVQVFDPLTAPWQNDDVSGVGVQGFAVESGGDSFTVSGSGSRIAGNSAAGGDSFHYVYQEVAQTSGIEVVARIDAIDLTGAAQRTGLMFRGDLGGVSANALLAVDGNADVILQNRSGTGGGTAEQARVKAVGLPVWLRLERTNTNEAAGAYSTDGINWIDLGQVAVNVGGGPKLLGLVVCSGANNTLNVSAFSEAAVQLVNVAPQVDAGPDRVVQNASATITLNGVVSDDGVPGTGLTLTWTQEDGPGLVTFADDALAVTDATFSAPGSYRLRLTVDDGIDTAFDEVDVTVYPALPLPWENDDVGGVGLPGFALFNPLDVAFELNATGIRIGGNPGSGADSFHYVHQPIDGSNLAIFARITQVDALDPDSRAGVMFRSNLGFASSNAFVGWSPDIGLVYTARGGTNGGTTLLATDDTVDVPVWVRLIRTGTNNVRAAYATNGWDWVDLGQATVNVGGGSKLIGLAAVSGTQQQRGAARFERVYFGDPCPTDYDADGQADLLDFAIQQTFIGVQSGATTFEGDTDNDGDVDEVDALVTLDFIGTLCP